MCDVRVCATCVYVRVCACMCVYVHVATIGFYTYMYIPKYMALFIDIYIFHFQGKRFAMYKCHPLI